MTYSGRLPIRTRTRIIPQSQRMIGTTMPSRGSYTAGLAASAMRYSRDRASAPLSTLYTALRHPSYGAPTRTHPSYGAPTRYSTLRPIRESIFGPTRKSIFGPSRAGPTGIIPPVSTTPSLVPPTGGGLPTPTGAGLGLGLGDTIGDAKALGGNILEQSRALIPTAIKIIGAVVVFKIVLWVLKGRRR